ncbi:hypothetical protein FOA52_003406 [Chlamydomonas sp. UWO 241]|nr:hypothetical protein FOA52_003406 [Chlamydomonas sp. UWO 241]
MASSSSSGKNAIVWFRKGLRLHDNPALLEASRDAAHLYPLFILDPHFLKSGSYRVGVNRYNFLLESLADLDASLRKRGSRLLVVRGTPEEVLPRVMREWHIKQLCFEVDTEPYALARDVRVRELARGAGVEVSAHVSHTLYDTSELVERNGGKAPLTMTSFTKLLDKAGKPHAPASDPSAALPGPAKGAVGTAEDETSVPTWQEVGFTEAPTSPFKGGETEALARLERSMADSAWVAAFEKPSTDPSAFTQPATTVLSPYLKFGCLSPRLFYSRLLEVYARHPKHSQPPVSLRGQLLWREFFYTVGAATPNFSRMEGNPICRQIDWDANEEGLAAWAAGQTGFPWIDACMTQLKEWGWMHHLARHSVACFLTRGDLYVSWERGQEVFEELLLDADHFLNAGNWMWLSASAFFNSYFRVYSPIVFGKKYDPEGKFIRRTPCGTDLDELIDERRSWRPSMHARHWSRWLPVEAGYHHGFSGGDRRGNTEKYDPEGKFIRRFLPVLKDMPAKYIYEPWLAPLDVQKRAKCIIGTDYPRPIVDHGSASKTAVARIGAAYRAGKAPAGGEGDEGGDEGGGGGGASGSGVGGGGRGGGGAGGGRGGGGAKKGAAAEAKSKAGGAAAEKGGAGKRQKTLFESGVTKASRKGGDAA